MDSRITDIRVGVLLGLKMSLLEQIYILFFGKHGCASASSLQDMNADGRWLLLISIFNKWQPITGTSPACISFGDTHRPGLSAINHRYCDKWIETGTVSSTVRYENRIATWWERRQSGWLCALHGGYQKHCSSHIDPLNCILCALTAVISLPLPFDRCAALLFSWFRIMRFFFSAMPACNC